MGGMANAFSENDFLGNASFPLTCLLYIPQSLPLMTILIPFQNSEGVLASANYIKKILAP